MKGTRTLAEQVADLDDPAPKEFDPEQEDGHGEDDSSSGAEDGDENLAEAREHYVDVGKSKLRKSDGVDLGPQYKGASVSRDALQDEEIEDDPFASHSEQEESEKSDHVDSDEDLDLKRQDDDEEIDSGEAFGSGDEDRFGEYNFRGSKKTGLDVRDSEGSEIEGSVDEDGDEGMEVAGDYLNGLGELEQPQDDDDADTNMDYDEESTDSDNDNTSISLTPNEPKADDRAALRKMMAEEQKAVAASLSKAAKADIAKGRAIKYQRTAFDALLNTRIKLQKALISTNSLSASTSTSTEDTEAIRAAETAALNLWNTVSTLRSSFQSSTSKNKPISATTSTPSPTLWNSMQSHETTSLPTRRTTLTKWSLKTNPASTLPRTSKFTQTPPHQPLTSVLDQHLTGSSLTKLLSKTHTPRSCAPLQTASRAPTDASIYDDADFYTLLLRELVEQRMADSSAPLPSPSADRVPAPTLPSQRELKVKKQVDTKASKGRKMRYTVHEKLQNFMAPEDRGSWGERQRGELFGSLLGRKVEMDEEGEMELDGGEGSGGLKLFG
ncbi:hypothetical protein N7G274_002502 [Stereocaulon virgatum]|uniref:Protein BFR2 n=1 Tax=Stereocaulon virgatum TaxID=373712 RepID=A0ABR4AFY9_9LECA